MRVLSESRERERAANARFFPPPQFDAAAFEKFLIDSIKVEGKTGQLGEDVKITREGSGQLAVVSSIPFSKRYLKYLTKKFLKVRGLSLQGRDTSTDTVNPVCRRT